MKSLISLLDIHIEISQKLKSQAELLRDRGGRLTESGSRRSPTTVDEFTALVRTLYFSWGDLDDRFEKPLDIHDIGTDRDMSFINFKPMYYGPPTAKEGRK